MIEALERCLTAAVEAGDPPSAQCCVIGERVLHQSAHGASADGEHSLDERTLFDVASVTKIVATTSAVALLVSRGALELDAPVARALAAFGKSGKGDITVRELLGHRSGLAAWDTFFVRCSSKEEVLDEVLGAQPAHARGTRVYSDLGFLALGALVEAVAAEPLEIFCARELWGPLGLAGDVGFLPRGAPASWAKGRAIAATGRTRPREPAPGQETLYAVPPQAEAIVRGEVDDDNAWVMGGVAGHAGVFATAHALARFGRWLLEESEGADRLGLGELLRTELFATDPATSGPTRALGFDVPTGTTSSVGATFGRGPKGAVGHLGFTGCSLWMDRDRGLSVALLTNRTLPGRHRVDGIRALRRAVHGAAMEALGADA